MWELSDIESTHRIGQTRGRYRPLIVQFQSVDHKLSILLRESLRINGIKVSTDLTPRQRDEIHNHRQAGRVAYFRFGRLHVEDKPAGSKDYRENRHLKSSAEKEISASSVKDHHPFSHRRQSLRSSTEKKSLPFQSRIITVSHTDAPLPDNNGICPCTVMPSFVGPTGKAGAILTTGVDLPGTKGKVGNGMNNTGAIRNTMRLGTNPLTTALDMQYGYKALMVALPGGIGTRLMPTGQQRSTTVSPIPMSTKAP